MICIYESLSLPIYTQKLDVPAAYAFLKDKKTDEQNRSIMEFPLFFTDRIDILGKKETIYLFYQTIHEYKMINGYLSYTPQKFLRKYSDIPGMLFLIEPAYYGKPQTQDLETLKEFLFEKAGLKYAIFHRNLLKTEDYEILSQFFQNELSGKSVYCDKDITVFEFN